MTYARKSQVTGVFFFSVPQVSTHYSQALLMCRTNDPLRLHGDVTLSVACDRLLACRLPNSTAVADSGLDKSLADKNDSRSARCARANRELEAHGERLR